MSASGLRRECARGRLVVERIAGKDYTTLVYIERMRELCRVAVKGHVSSFGRSDAENQVALSKMPLGSSSTPSTGDTKRAQAAALTIVKELKGRSQIT
jgi:hypothetical protein